MVETIPLFSVSQFTTWHQTFEEDIALYRKLGLEGIEVCQRKLATDPGQAREQLALVRDSGLKVTSVQPRVHALFSDSMCPELDDPIERLNRYRQTIALFAEAFPGEELSLVTITGNAPNHNYRLAHRTARQLYPGLADYAADYGLRIMLEPLSPVLMNNDTFICTLNEAIQLIDDVDRPNFGLMLDIWHIWREPALYERLQALGERIFGVHLSDWPAGEPRHTGDRRICGQGIIDLPRLLGAIERAGYGGAYCLEIFSIDDLPDSLWLADPVEVIGRSRIGFEQAWQARQ
jgi:sugar phosphate isomerase/epimerase